MLCVKTLTWGTAAMCCRSVISPGRCMSNHSAPRCSITQPVRCSFAPAAGAMAWKTLPALSRTSHARKLAVASSPTPTALSVPQITVASIVAIPRWYARTPNKRQCSTVEPDSTTAPTFIT
eukprot:3460014-Rhodomonas_salina.3